MSELARKLAAMKQKSAAPAKEKAPELMERAFSRPVDERLYAVSDRAIERMGLPGGSIDWEKCAFLDTETTGLSRGAGTVAFLVGVGRIQGGVFTVRQALMPDYPAEPLLLKWVEKQLEGADTLITFNGKAFDVPLLKTRRVMCRMGEMGEFREWDLLFPARRVWKLRLKSVRLARIEDVILGLGREGDIPGSEAPQRYFEYLKTGYFPPLEDVIEHNRQDVANMETLMAELGRVYGSPSDNAQQLDLFSLGRAMEKRKEAAEALACYQRAGIAPPATSLSALEGRKYAYDALVRAARMQMRAGRVDQAREILERLAQQKGWEARTELSKLYEHKMRDYRLALKWAKQAQEDAQTPAQSDDALKRVARLSGKTEE